ncbi:hypothetical protein OG400_07855 [Micromonospora ureilytica]|uniref:hypothetical protein n=1 Tax=Micromonospora ureilytica TaxID=709868 RepID=UPI002E1342F4|nr:hypothetical protein OG400_07855 [Micromonospora ureilytica]
MLAIRRAGLPASLLASLKHAASLANPEFHKNENLRLSNWNTPRFVRCYTEDLEFLYLPWAMADKATELVAQAGSRLDITDRRADPPPVDVTFTATLRDCQPAAVATIAATSTACWKLHRDGTARCSSSIEYRPVSCSSSS